MTTLSTIQETQILDCLSLQPNQTAKDLAKSLLSTTPISEAKTAINKILYSLLKQKNVTQSNDTPPKWSINNNNLSNLKTEEKSCHEPKLIILIDLGNTHDCLKNLVPYTAQPNIDIYAFADRAFNGYGVNPHAPSPITVFQATTPDKNAADLELIYICLKLILTTPFTYHFVVASKDQGFHSLQNIVERHGHKLHFVTNWEQLRQYVE